MILTADGAVLSFGLNDAGQLGHSEGAGYVTVPVSGVERGRATERARELFFSFRLSSLTFSTSPHKKTNK